MKIVVLFAASLMLFSCEKGVTVVLSKETTHPVYIVGVDSGNNTNETIYVDKDGFAFVTKDGMFGEACIEYVVTESGLDVTDKVVSRSTSTFHNSDNRTYPVVEFWVSLDNDPGWERNTMTSFDDRLLKSKIDSFTISRKKIN